MQHCEESPDSWVTADQFKAGLAIIQAMPGPMFNLSAYLGAVMAVRAGWAWPAGVAACWLGLFGPGIMLLYGLLPFWGSFRQLQVRSDTCASRWSGARLPAWTWRGSVSAGI